MYITTDILDPMRQKKVENLNPNFLKTLPKDYLSFLLDFGIGTYCDEVNIIYPDSQSIYETFKDYSDFWEFSECFDRNDFINAIQIGSSTNGDIICTTENRKNRYFILPRNSINIISLNTFKETLEFLLEKISPKKYFDPSYDKNYEQIFLNKSNKGLIDINPIHRKFIDKFTFDFITNENTQPKYFLKQIGGWVNFDLIYKNSININYQTRYFENVKLFSNFIKKHI